MARDIQGDGIRFGDWKIIVADGENWELAHLRVTGDTASAREKGTVGKVQWHRCSKFFNEHSIGSALLYAADQEMKAKHKDSEVEIREALQEYERILTDFREAFAESVDKLKDSTRPVRGRKK